MRHVIRYALMFVAAIYLWHAVNAYEYETIWSDHAVAVHFREWDPLVPMSMGWGYGLFAWVAIGVTSKPVIKWATRTLVVSK
jgi:hypothetical protein